MGLSPVDNEENSRAAMTDPGARTKTSAAADGMDGIMGCV